MEREEAIKRLEVVRTNALIQKANGASEYWQEEIDGTIEAIDMAIEALSAEPTIPIFAESAEAYKKWTGEDMGKTDLISRADVLKYPIRLDHYDEVNGSREFVYGVESVIEYVEALPSADAKPIMTEEVREALMRLTMCAREDCAMCKYKDECDFDFQYKISTDNMNTLSDALMRSRCEVDAKSAEAVHIETYRELYEKYVNLKHASADAVHGEWLYVENEPYSECSKCGRYIDDLDEDKYAYCPYCGAIMKGGAE